MRILLPGYTDAACGQDIKILWQDIQILWPEYIDIVANIYIDTAARICGYCGQDFQEYTLIALQTICPPTVN
jgi:hypothetical protein